MPNDDRGSLIRDDYVNVCRQTCLQRYMSEVPPALSQILCKTVHITEQNKEPVVGIKKNNPPLFHSSENGNYGVMLILSWHSPENCASKSSVFDIYIVVKE